MKIEFIDHNSPFLQHVIELGQKNAKTLGLMPKDAYIQQAKRKCIVIAFEENKLIGYCLFRETVSKRRIGITQLCLEQSSRKKGIASQLLDKIRDRYKVYFDGMLVSCREDYVDACNLWERYGFIRNKRVRSRSKDEKYLIKFWYNYGQKDLFSLAESPNLKAVLDLNIIIKMRDQDSSESISHLTADWLIDEVDFCYVSETLNEIHRDSDYSRTASTKKFLSQFTELQGSAEEIKAVLPILESIHPGESQNTISDRKQLAECKAIDLQYFITTDTELLNKSEDILEQIGISVLNPSQFIVLLDELKNRRLYEPRRLKGANFQFKLVSSSDIPLVINTFLLTGKSESKKNFETKVQSLVADTKNSKVKIVLNSNDQLVACVGTTLHEDSISLSIVRILKTDQINFENTLFYQLINETIKESLFHDKVKVEVKEDVYNEYYKLILERNGFSCIENQWVKYMIKGIYQLSKFQESSMFKKLDDELQHAIKKADDLFENDLNEYKLGLERKLWPIKLSDLELPVFIIPIRPLWASQLFDFLSAENMLFGAKAELSWSNENVYYRSHRPDVEIAPARILWYASEDKNNVRSKSIVACSYLNEFEIGSAKELFSKFKRFGVYEWKQIWGLAKKDNNTLIKALQFSNTEVFQKPISFEITNEILLESKFKKQTFVSPVKVNNEVFIKIYKIGAATV
jgi:GNAT superfamily N-acetyltransferase